MKPFKIIICFFILLSFASCGKSEFMNLYSFTEIYNKTSRESINISDFYFQPEDKHSYTAFLGDEVSEILLTLKSEETDIIEEIRLSLVKERSHSPAATQTDLFTRTLRNTLSAFCSYTKDETDNIISAFELDNPETFIREGELTLTAGNFHFVYYSTELISQVIIYNTYLHKIEATEKPVSKPYYAEDFIIKEKETP
jgi:hypothetical protein